MLCASHLCLQAEYIRIQYFRKKKFNHILVALDHGMFSNSFLNAASLWIKQINESECLADPALC